jgi:16S rRNA (cytosine1402-N4)-methyltransferase
VKRFFAEKSKLRTGPKELPDALAGKPPVLKILTRKVLTPSAGEIEENNRARSAKLRAAEKI